MKAGQSGSGIRTPNCRASRKNSFLAVQAVYTHKGPTAKHVRKACPSPGRWILTAKECSEQSPAEKVNCRVSLTLPQPRFPGVLEKLLFGPSARTSPGSGGCEKKKI